MKRLLLAITLILGGCATTKPNYFVETIQDNVDNQTIYRAQDNKIGYPDGTNCRAPKCDITFGTERDDCAFQIGIQKAIDKGTTRYKLIVNYENTDWFFIDEGETLIMKIDGKRIAFSGSGSGNNRKVLKAGELGLEHAAVHETAFYPIELKTLKKLATASDVQVKLVGQNSFAQRCLTPDNIAFFARFIAEMENK